MTVLLHIFVCEEVDADLDLIAAEELSFIFLNQHSSRII